MSAAPDPPADGLPGVGRRRLPPSGASSVTSLLTTGALLVVWASLVASILVPLALNRYLHVDEVQVAYNAALLGIHHLPEYLNFHAPLIVPLSWLASGHEATWPFLMEARGVFLMLFIVDLVLVAVFAPRVRGWPARAAVLLGVTLVEPFWRHGFEIRHDVLLLAGSLGLFACAQLASRSKTTRWPLFTAGLLAAWVQLNSLKAILVWPAALVLVLLARFATSAAGRRTLRESALWIAAGLASGLAMGVALLASAGLADDYFLRLIELGGAAREAQRFAPGGRLLALLVELFHLTALAAFAVAHLVARVRRGGWRGEIASIVTAAWFLLQVVALHLNPVPFTYNFVHVLPFLFLLSVDGVGAIGRALRPGARNTLVAATLLVAAATCWTSWRGDRVGRTSSAAQRRHIETAEALTSSTDPVLDGAGLVATRKPPNRHWMLHSLMMPAYRRGEVPPFRTQLELEPAPVLITNYRWDWLAPEDSGFVRSRYVSIAPRMFVLGGSSSDGGGRFAIHRRGRYLVRPHSSRAVRLDSNPLPPGGVVPLERGLHDWSGGGIAWAWLGPTLSAVPEPGPLLSTMDLFVSD